jgi:predicted nucleic acid-binding protein
MTETSIMESRAAIDANAYRNLDFINFLKKNRDTIRVFLPSIVFIEIGYYFRSKGLSWDWYLKEIESIGGTVIDWSEADAEQVIEHAIENRANLPFQEHFRDFIIGVQCMNIHVDLVTFNTSHFVWCDGIRIITPNEFVGTWMGDSI